MIRVSLVVRDYFHQISINGYIQPFYYSIVVLRILDFPAKYRLRSSSLVWVLLQWGSETLTCWQITCLWLTSISGIHNLRHCPQPSDVFIILFNNSSLNSNKSHWVQVQVMKAPPSPKGRDDSHPSKNVPKGPAYTAPNRPTPDGGALRASVQWFSPPPWSSC